ncbi:MAG: MBL fold metallo-hydrolase [Gammaproteobacteria bacterium]|nr:MBL fold metallo-hydrolase [Gammaproteobacteria bacterium]
MEAVQLSRQVYYVKGVPGIPSENEGFISNAGFIVGRDGVVVFDALGTPSLAWRLLQIIRQVTDKPVLKVVVSHYHADHIYGLQVFREAGAEIVAPKGAFEYIDSTAAAERLQERRDSLSPWVNEHTRLIRPDRIIEQDTSIDLGDMVLQLRYLGAAHSDGDLSMLVEPDGVLFFGDLLFEGRLPFVGDADSRRWLSILEDMQSMQVAALVPGHGPVARHPSELIKQTRDYLVYLRKVMGVAVEEMTEFAEAYEAADWSRYQQLPAFQAANRRNAYQVYLSMEQESMGRE